MFIIVPSIPRLTDTAASTPLFNFIFVGSNIPKLLFQCCCRFDSCWCLETHVGVWKHMLVFGNTCLCCSIAKL